LAGNGGLSVRLKIHPLLCQSTGLQETVDVEGTTVGECLRHLQRRFPDIRSKLFTEQGKLKAFIDVYINNRSTYPQGLDHPVVEGDELAIMLMLGGG